MNGAFYVGAVGLQAQQRALEVISNNIANINTPAFKRSDIRFAEMLASRSDTDVVPANADTVFAPAGVATHTALAIDEAGVIETTGRTMDVAINGRGFIELMGPSGQTFLWRGGPLKVGEAGLLTAADSGLALRAAITMPADATAITISGDGTVSAKTGDVGEPVEIGQIAIVYPEDTATLTAVDGGLYRTADDSRLTPLQAGEEGAGVLVQGGIERSNVEMTTQMVQMMLIQRAYAANAQIVQAADQLMSISNGLRR